MFAAVYKWCHKVILIIHIRRIFMVIIMVASHHICFYSDGGDNAGKLRWCLHDTEATFIPGRVHPGSLLWLCIRLHDTTTKCHAGASHTGASSPRFLCRNEIFIPARKFIPVSCKHSMTVRFIFIEASSILRHFKTRTPINTALCKHGATFHLAPEWKSRRYHVNIP